MRVVIADDHPLYLEAVGIQVTRTFPDAEVRTATTMDGVMDLLAKFTPDMVMLDYSMPGMCGGKGVRRVIAAVGEDVPVLMMSGVASRNDVVDCIAAGAKGYIPKTLQGPLFSAAISLVAGGATYIPTEFVSSEPQAQISARLSEELTPRDLTMLRFLVGGDSNKEIARHFAMPEVTVKYHLSRLYRKMGVNNRAQAVAAAVKAGVSSTSEAGPRDSHSGSLS
ncbi:response regulator [Telmatospirillum siberiense]|uniref:DNA-binding response regulator n=1 Tax=Telmatospirillum siberiense TaxID=382514 RepID=A0A2N3PMJ6_9PROT|nr:response regulator transcription factor [Telmatospirillum siberiense]PKU21628.1 DNA-binding response regulator [Telmatospirillum siberiense]